jgi:hypothetical protein
MSTHERFSPRLDPTNPLVVHMTTGAELTPGCWVAGHHGQYAIDVAADLASLLGWSPESWAHDPNTLRSVIECIDGQCEASLIGRMWDMHIECYDHITDWLNEHTSDGHWEWIEGELFLQHASTIHDELFMGGAS